MPNPHFEFDNFELIDFSVLGRERVRLRTNDKNLDVAKTCGPEIPFLSLAGEESQA